MTLKDVQQRWPRQTLPDVKALQWHEAWLIENGEALTPASCFFCACLGAMGEGVLGARTER